VRNDPKRKEMMLYFLRCRECCMYAVSLGAVENLD